MTANNNKKTLVLLDAHAILHRAYHAMPDFTNSKGEPTGGLYGIATMVFKAVDELKPDYMIACYDLPGPTHRHEAYDEYKAGRGEADDALVAQMTRSRDLFEALGIPCLDAPGFEADDLLGTLAKQAEAHKDLSVVIASGDMDTLQLVDGTRVRVYTLKKGIKDTIIYDEKGVFERHGFGPELLPDFKGLRGDPSDNIPGIRGIGEKTATELIVQFGGIDDIYTTLKKDPTTLEKAGIKKRIIGLLEEGEDDARFSRELATIRLDAPVTLALPERSWREALDTDALFTLFTELEFRSLIPRVKALLGGDSTALKVEAEEETVSQNELREMSILLWLVHSDLVHPKKEDILEYTRTDSLKTAHKKLLDELREKALVDVFEKIEKPLMPVADEMERYGVLLDTAYLKTLSKDYKKEVEKIEQRIYKTAGTEFNINSPKQLGDILFDTLGIKAKTKKTATGQRSTKESELVKLADEHPIVNDILAYRERQKLLSTYIEALPKLVDGEGRLHAQFLQHGTTTGRMSSQNPNLQNIPIRTEDGRAIRNAFTVPDGFVLLAADYSQIELRVAAFLSGDEKLIGVFTRGEDIHTAVAAEVFNVPADMVDREMRRRAKIINFGILYGMGVNALQQNLGSSRAEAQSFLAEYFKRFSGIARYIELMKAEVHQRGYTETFFGRRRYFESIHSPLPYIQAAAERMAINAPIQGTQADIIKLAMVRIEEYRKEHSLYDDLHLTMQVHDELVFEVREKRLKELAPELVRIMESVLPLSETKGVALAVECEVGKNWGEVKKYEV